MEEIAELPDENNDPSVNIYDLLLKPPEKKKEEKRSRRAELLESIGVKDCFKEGSIEIDMRTCRGIECNLCVKACPTNALYWRGGEIGIEEDLCIHCTACVLSCCVDDCIQVSRKRLSGKTERFSTPKDVLKLNRNIISRKKREAVKSILKNPEKYFTDQE